MGSSSSNSGKIACGPVDIFIIIAKRAIKSKWKGVNKVKTSWGCVIIPIAAAQFGGLSYNGNGKRGFLNIHREMIS
jgi:hypothetical protein